MHKSVFKNPQRLISRRKLRKAFKYLEPLGLFYEGRNSFWDSTVNTLSMYLQDPQTDKGIVKRIHKFLRKTGIAEKKLPARVEGAYNCERLNCTVYSPCQEKVCPFWGDYPSRLNCIHVYLDDQNREGMTVAEMGIMSGFSRVYINNLLQSGMTRLRSSGLTDLKEESFESKLEVVQFDGVCVGCGGETKNPEGLYCSEFDQDKKYVYCSLQCYAAKPPVTIFLEKHLCVPIAEIVSSMSKRYEDMAEAASCLTLDKTALTHAVQITDPSHVFLSDSEPPQIQDRVSGKKTWERESRKLREKLTLLDKSQERQLFA